MAGGTDDTESCLDILATPASDSLLFFLAVGGISEISKSLVRDSLWTLAWRPGMGIDFLEVKSEAGVGSCDRCVGAFSCTTDPF